MGVKQSKLSCGEVLSGGHSTLMRCRSFQFRVLRSHSLRLFQTKETPLCIENYLCRMAQVEVHKKEQSKKENEAQPLNNHDVARHHRFIHT